MKFKSFSGWSTLGLDKHVNRFIEANPSVEIIDIKFSVSFGMLFAAVLYKDELLN